jgi:hypothetical protein
MRRRARREEDLGAAIGLDNLALLVHGDHVGDPRPFLCLTPRSAWVGLRLGGHLRGVR